MRGDAFEYHPSMQGETLHGCKFCGSGRVYMSVRGFCITVECRNCGVEVEPYTASREYHDLSKMGIEHAIYMSTMSFNRVPGDK
jgi:uncharacterized protein (DUF983 family)